MAINIGVIALEGPFTIAGSISSILAFLVATIVLYLTADAMFFSPKRNLKRRQEELRHPAIVRFLVPERPQREVDFAIQDGDEHLLREIVLPPNTIRTIEIFIKAHTNFNRAEFHNILYRVRMRVRRPFS